MLCCSEIFEYARFCGLDEKELEYVSSAKKNMLEDVEEVDHL